MSGWAEGPGGGLLARAIGDAFARAAQGDAENEPRAKQWPCLECGEAIEVDPLARLGAPRYRHATPQLLPSHLAVRSARAEHPSDRTADRSVTGRMIDMDIRSLIEHDDDFVARIASATGIRTWADSADLWHIDETNVDQVKVIDAQVHEKAIEALREQLLEAFEGYQPTDPSSDGVS